MALVKFGGGITQMSGSVGGTTFARNRYGNYARAKTKPVNPNTAAQAAIRSALSELTVLWSQTLSAAQRTAWNLYGASVAMKNRLGETTYLTGFNHYIRSNVMRNRVGLGVVNDGPVIFELPAADLRDRFVVGSADTYAQKETGGSPKHLHISTTDGHTHVFDVGAVVPFGASWRGDTLETKPDIFTDYEDSHPPFRSLYYIMRVE